MNRLGLGGGSELEVGETQEGVTLKPTGHPSSMSKEHGLWVYTGKLPVGFDSVQAIRDDRDERIRRSAGL